MHPAFAAQETPVGAEKLARVAAIRTNFEILLMVGMQTAMEHLGRDLESDEIGATTEEIVARVRTVRPQCGLSRSAMNKLGARLPEVLADRIAALPARHLAGLPDLGVKLSDEELAGYVRMSIAKDARLAAFAADMSRLSQDVRNLLER